MNVRLAFTLVMATAVIVVAMSLPVDNSVGFFALVGMGAMMSGSLQAPLAALTAMLELTDQPEIILPGMLALIAGVLVSREVFGKDSVYLMLMKARGLDYRATPIPRSACMMVRGTGCGSPPKRTRPITPRVERIGAVFCAPNSSCTNR